MVITRIEYWHQPEFSGNTSIVRLLFAVIFSHRSREAEGVGLAMPSLSTEIWNHTFPRRALGAPNIRHLSRCQLIRTLQALQLPAVDHILQALYSRHHLIQSLRITAK